MARIIEFEGRHIEVPDDATEDEIRGILGDSTAPAASQSTTQPDLATQAAATLPKPEAVNQGVNAPLYTLQRANRGLADALGAPVDLASMGVNAVLAGADTVAEQFGGNVDTRVEAPFLGSDWIAGMTSDLYRAGGGHMIDRDKVSPMTRMLGEAIRFGTGSVLGSGAAASQSAQRAAQAPGQVGRLLGPITAPYKQSARPMVGDAVAGAGAGATVSGYEDYAPEGVEEFMGPFGPALASLAGGVGATTSQALTEGAAGLAKNTARAVAVGRGDPHAPIYEGTGKRFTRAEMDEAARAVQSQASNPKAAAATIAENTAELSDVARGNEVPTAGAISEDVGLALLEREARARNLKPFVERDQATAARAGEVVRGVAPAGADGRDFTGEATRRHDDALNTARQGVDDAAAREAAARTELQRQNADLEGFRARQTDASISLDREFRENLEATRGQKNALYDSVPDRTAVDGGALYEKMMSVEQSVPRAARTGTDYSTVSGRLRDLIRNVDPDTGEETLRDLTYGDLKVLRADVNALRKDGVAAGRDVTYLDRVGRVLGDAIDDINPEAREFYANEFAPRFKTGKAGEYEASLKRAVRTGDESSGARPSEFGDKFLKKPEDAASLERAVGVNANPQTAQQASDWMMGDLAKSGVLTENAEIRYDRFRKWSDRNRAVIDQFPAVRQRVDAELASAQRGGQISRRLAEEVRQAEGRLADTVKNKGALGLVIGKDPINAVSSVFSSGDPENAMKAIVGEVGNDQRAIAGLKAAVVDYITQKTTQAAVQKTADGSRPVDFARLENLFNRHEKTLAAAFSPEEMNALRQTHKMLKPQMAIKQPAGATSLYENKKRDHAWMMLEGGLKARYGVLKGGGILRTIRIFVATLPNRDEAVKDIVLRMHFDPELAVHLLGRDVKVDTPAWNAKLNRLLATATLARESVGEE